MALGLTIMINVTLVLQKKGRGDDVITMSNSQDMTFITYRDGDRKGRYEFNLDQHDAYTYVSEFLLGLSHDMDPFDYIQVIPCIGPSILYNIWELENETIRDLILSQIHTSLCGEVRYNRYG